MSRSGRHQALPQLAYRTACLRARLNTDFRAATVREWLRAKELRLNKREQFGVDLVSMGGAHPVRKSGVPIGEPRRQRAPLWQTAITGIGERSRTAGR
jgi:hypothetical protein